MVPQDIFLVPLIPGTDGRKMGKSFNNAIDIITPPPDMFGKVMSMSDDVMPLYFEVLTDVPTEEIEALRRELAAGRGNPMELKKRLAREIVAQFHSAPEAEAAQKAFERQFQRGELPEDIADFPIERPMNIVDYIAASGMASSKSEARRLVEGGGVYLISGGDKVRVADFERQIDPAEAPIVQVGKRKFARARQK
jgi:tyrosyl-tRNA synthetase